MKSVLDRMAELKLNRFHWHLTDDQGWRLDIPGLPELVKCGAVRPSSPKPGIEIPGHTRALLASHPEFACPGVEFEPTPWCEYGICSNVVCAGSDEMLACYRRIFDEVLKMFPGEYVHIGGDECLKTQWRNCPKCRARMESEGLADVEALQGWITRQMVEYVSAKGRRVIGWDEILDGGELPKGTINIVRGTLIVKGSKTNVFTRCALVGNHSNPLYTTESSNGVIVGQYSEAVTNCYFERAASVASAVGTGINTGKSMADLGLQWELTTNGSKTVFLDGSRMPTMTFVKSSPLRNAGVDHPLLGGLDLVRGKRARLSAPDIGCWEFPEIAGLKLIIR